MRKSNHAQPLAELFTRACLRVVEDGRCSRSNAVRVLRRWRRLGLGMNADVTLGLAARLQEKVGVHPLELMDREELLLGPPDAARRLLVAAEQERQASQAKELLQHEAFKRASMGGAGAYILSIDEQGRCADVGNEAFARLVGGAGWPGRQMHACKTIPPLVAACVCAPVDRPALLEVRCGCRSIHLA